jgi:hypothetical protein
MPQADDCLDSVVEILNDIIPAADPQAVRSYAREIVQKVSLYNNSEAAHYNRLADEADYQRGVEA